MVSNVFVVCLGGVIITICGFGVITTAASEVGNVTSRHWGDGLRERLSL